MRNDIKKKLKRKFADMLPFLNEKQRRIFAASEAKAIGRGGIQAVSTLTGISRQTIYRGLKELTQKEKNVDGSIRRRGGGRKKIAKAVPNILEALESLIEPSVKGDPESLLRWTCRSVRNLEDDMKKMGFELSYRSIARILGEMEYSMQGNRKNSEGKPDHPDRNAQFEFINAQSKKFLKSKCPVISVDTKKKELVGNFKNGGKEWKSKGKPIDVLSHDFPDPDMPKAVPYGVYDIGRNAGWVNVGMSADTAEFAVESIRQWWLKMGFKQYKDSQKILICADAGGSNSYRSRLWKFKLQEFCNEQNISVSVCHFPPGTSKWNKIEHRLFSFISMNWRGKPLVDYLTIVNLIANTSTKTGLKVMARMDKKKYQRGIKLKKSDFDKINLKQNKFHGEWNYTIHPQKNV